MICKNTKAMFQPPDGDTGFFAIVAGILQGNTLRLFPFIICLQYVLRKSVDQIKENEFTLKKKKRQKVEDILQNLLQSTTWKVNVPD